MESHYKVYGVLAEILVRSDTHTATKVLSDKHVVKATRKLFGGKIDKRNRRIEIVFTDGVPNYAAREFIKECKKAGEPLPVKNIQLTFPPRRKNETVL